MTNSEAVSGRESKGRRRLLKLIEYLGLTERVRVLFTEGQYDRFDAEMTGRTEKFFIEIKTADRPYTQYEDYQIDYEKLTALITLSKADNRVPMLIVFFTDCTIIWDLSTLTEEIENRKETVFCTRHTAFSYGNRVPKTETHLKAEESRWKGPRIQ